ncbi:MAG TPA: hypothetical protein VHG69_08290 [Thermoleophilaceae bacterium]|nr:hypothetical protein [Thermoleophilaceae bacterium]
MAMAPDGTIHLAYRNGSGNSPVPGQTAVRTRRPDGSFSPDQQLLQPASVTNNVPQGLTVAESGVATVLWRDNQAGDLLLRRISPTGVLDPTTHQIDEDGVFFGSASALADDSAGNSYVAYLAGNRVRLRAVSAQGVKGQELTLGTPGESPGGLTLATAPDGTAFVAWYDSSAQALRLQVVSPAGAAGPVETVSAGPNTFGPRLGLDGLRRLYIAWYDGDEPQVKLRVRQPDGSYGPTEVVSPFPGPTAFDVALGVAADGDAALVWEQGSNPERIMGRRRGADGSYGPVVPIDAGETGVEVQHPKVVVESGGIAVAAWQRYNAGIFTNHARGFRPDSSLDPPIEQPAEGTGFFVGGDGVGNTALATAEESPNTIDVRLGDFGGPEQRSLVAPPVVERTSAQTFSFSPFDLLSTVAGSHWEFSDGEVATGSSTTRTFPVAGDLVARSVTIDSVGNVRSIAHPLRVADTVRPAIRRLRLSRKRFRLGRRPIPRSTARARRGTTLRYALTENATVTLRVERRTVGRRVRGRCRRATRRNRARRRCVRFVAVRGFGRITRRQLAGARSIPFSGRVGRRKLAPGRYRFALVAADPSGNRSAPPARRSFRVVRR